MMIPQTDFEGFRIDEVLSRSSTTTVYRAYQFSLKRQVLIKELRPELFQEQDLRERFEREAQVCAHIKHENIVDIHEYSTLPDRNYLVMEYVDGHSLADLLHDQPIPSLELAYSIIIQTLRGLAYAHSKGVVHRDLKPGNILISRTGWVKITDFGLALIEGSPQITHPGTVVGTPAYLSPEAIRGGAITASSDIFSLGVTFYQLLTGKRIFYAEHFSDSLSKVLSFHPPKPSQIRPDIPAEVDRIVSRMLEKQPSKRWASCDEILAEFGGIEGFSQFGDPKQIIRRYWESPAGADAARAAKVVGGVSDSHRLKMRTAVWLGLSLVIAIVFILGIRFLLTNQRSLRDQSALSRRSEGTAFLDTASSQAPELIEYTAPLQWSTEPDREIGSDSALGGGTLSEVEPSTSLRRRDNGAADLPPKPSPKKSDQAERKDFLASEPLANLVPESLPARLQVICDPWAEVYVDDILVGKTPIDFILLQPGERHLVFRHPMFAPILRDVTTEPGESMTVKVSFWDTVGRVIILVDPWAEIYLDGNFVDVTPLKEPLVVPLGTHTITLKNPSAEPWEKELIFKRGDPPCTLRVALKSTNG